MRKDAERDEPDCRLPRLRQYAPTNSPLPSSIADLMFPRALSTSKRRKTRDSISSEGRVANGIEKEDRKMGLKAFPLSSQSYQHAN